MSATASDPEDENEIDYGEDVEDFDDYDEDTDICLECDGNGINEDGVDCPYCFGSGEI